MPGPQLLAALNAMQLPRLPAFSAILFCRSELMRFVQVWTAAKMKTARSKPNKMLPPLPLS
jgi:hypothetical protein